MICFPNVNINRLASYRASRSKKILVSFLNQLTRNGHKIFRYDKKTTGVNQWFGAAWRPDYFNGIPASKFLAKESMFYL